LYLAIFLLNSIYSLSLGVRRKSTGEETEISSAN